MAQGAQDSIEIGAQAERPVGTPSPLQRPTSSPSKEGLTYYAVIAPPTHPDTPTQAEPQGLEWSRLPGESGAETGSEAHPRLGLKGLSEFQSLTFRP